MSDSPSPIILAVPSELLLYIVTFMGVAEILRFRQTCRCLSIITRDHSLWMALLNEHRPTLPLPFDLSVRLRQESWSLQPLGESAEGFQPEDHFKNAYQRALRWAKPRARPPQKLPKLAKTILGLEVFLDQFLLCIFADGVLQLWHLPPEIPSLDDRPAEQLLSHSLGDPMGGGLVWGGYSARVDPSLKFIMVSVNGALSTSLTSLFRIDLSSTHGRHQASIQLVEPLPILRPSAQPLNLPRITRTIDPVLRVLVLAGTNVIEILPYENQPANSCICTLGRFIFEVQTGNMGEVWNGIVAARIMGPYLALFRLRSIEFHPLDVEVSCKGHPDDQRCPHFYPQGLPFLRHYFQSEQFRQVSLSEPSSWPRHPDPYGNVDPLRFSSLHADLMRGIFHYDIAVHFQPQADGSYQASLDVTETTSVHNPSNQLGGGISSPSGAVLSRGFVGAIALGCQGKRAVWVEQRRGHTNRDVLVWAKQPEYGDQNLAEREGTSYAVWEHKSYDLREDLIHCAIAESAGYIILGNRRGEMFVL